MCLVFSLLLKLEGEKGSGNGDIEREKVGGKRVKSAGDFNATLFFLQETSQRDKGWKSIYALLYCNNFTFSHFHYSLDCEGN